MRHSSEAFLDAVVLEHSVFKKVFQSKRTLMRPRKGTQLPLTRSPRMRTDHYPQ